MYVWKGKRANIIISTSSLPPVSTTQPFLLAIITIWLILVVSGTCLQWQQGRIKIMFLNIDVYWSVKNERKISKQPSKADWFPDWNKNADNIGLIVSQWGKSKRGTASLSFITWNISIFPPPHLFSWEKEMKENINLNFSLFQ